MLFLHAAVLAAATGSAACTAPPAWNATAHPIVLQSKFDATVWGGQQVHYTNLIEVKPKDATTANLNISTEGNAHADALEAKRSGCGTLANSDAGQRLEAYNNAVALAANAPSTVKPNDSWKSAVTLYVSQTQTLDVPVTVKVVKVDASGATLQATGQAQGTLTQYGTPINVTYQAAALFGEAGLQRADSAAQEAVQAGPQSQTMKFAWSVVRKS